MSDETAAPGDRWRTQIDVYARSVSALRDASPDGRAEALRRCESEWARVLALLEEDSQGG